jgi:transcriptional regulator with XRE-family HTH domain
MYEGIAKRIRALIDKAGLSDAEVAARLDSKRSPGMMGIWDLAAYDEELPTVTSIEDALRLANILGVSLRELLQPGHARVPVVSFVELTLLIKKKLEQDHLKLSEFEDLVGWRLEQFMADPNSAFDEPIIFLEWLCRELGIDLLTVIPEAMPGQVR